MQDKLMDKDMERENAAKKISKSLVFPRGGDEIIFDQPWELPHPRILKSFQELDANKRYIVSNFSYSPGLGNLMFQYVSLRVLAEKNNAYLILSPSCLLRRAFEYFSHVVFIEPAIVDQFLRKNSNRAYLFNECCKDLNDLHLFTYHNIEIVNGYFQTFLNFHPDHDKLIKAELKFLPEVRSSAEQILEEAKFARLRNESYVEFDENNEQNDAVLNIPTGIDENYIFIGVHVRHGLDVTFHSRNLNHGHLAAPTDYYLRAIEYFRRKFSEKKLIVMVASDAMSWAKNILKRIQNEVSIFYIESGYREIDFATLSLCNHTIISTGTYSWWAGYLSGGEVVYYKGWPKIGSTMAKMIDKDKYFLSNWIGL